MRFTSCALALALAACQANWISPYSADLQKRATDMLAEVTTLEITLAETDDVAAADPDKPAMQAKLAGWVGEVEAMAAIETSIDPQSAACDNVLGSIGGKAIASVEAQAARTGAMGIAGSAPLVLKCESLPDIFSRMRTELVQRIPHLLSEQCPSGQTAAQFLQRCRFLFEPDGTETVQARHGLLFSSLITALDSIIFREGRQAPRGK
jgi:hypothetical protein